MRFGISFRASLRHYDSSCLTRGITAWTQDALPISSFTERLHMPPDSFSVKAGISKNHLRRCGFCTNHHKLDSMCLGLRLQLLGILDSKTAALQIDACSPTKCFYFTVVATAESRQEGNIVMGLQLLSQIEFASSLRLPLRDLLN